MNRVKQREQAFILIFETMFNANIDNGDPIEIYSENIEEVGDYAKLIYHGVCEKADELDTTISQYLNGWKINRIPKVNLALLRLATYEMMFVEDVPCSVAINECIELAKTFSGTEDASFINGVLGSIARGME